MPSTDRATCWSVTINNPNSSDEENMANARRLGWKIEGQLEKGKDGTSHFQMMVKTPQVRFSQIKKMFPRGHIEVARNDKALANYVHKQDTKVGELPSNDRYVTSNTKFFALLVDVLETYDEDVDKRFRLIHGGLGEFVSPSQFDSLQALDLATSILITRGYYCVETMAVNPQVRKAWATFFRSIICRRQTDRQTEQNNVATISIPTLDGPEEEDDEAETECDEEEFTGSWRGEGDDNSSDEGSRYGEGSQEDSYEDDGQED